MRANTAAAATRSQFRPCSTQRWGRRLTTVLSFPAVSTDRNVIDGAPGVCVTVSLPARRRFRGGEWQASTLTGSASLLRRDVKKVIADLTEQLRLLDEGDGPAMTVEG